MSPPSTLSPSPTTPTTLTTPTTPTSPVLPAPLAVLAHPTKMSPGGFGPVPTALPARGEVAALCALAKEKRDAIYTTNAFVDQTGATRHPMEAGLDLKYGEALRDAIVARRAIRLLETGFAYGMSASWLLEGALRAWEGACQPAKRPPSLTSVDPYQWEIWKNCARLHLRDAGLLAFHRTIQEYSVDALPALIRQGETFDAIFIDGDHRFEHVFIDIFYARRLVAPGSLIVVDDEWMPAVRKAAAFFVQARLAKVVPAGNGIPEGRFIYLERTTEGEGRVWDAFEMF